MGGDDLGSDDEYLLSTVSDSVVQDTLEQGASGGRKRKAGNELVEADDSSPSNRDKKKRKNLSSEKLLLEAGKNLEKQSAEEQATFLTAAMKHYGMLSSANTGDTSEPFESRHFLTSQAGSLVDRISEAISLKKMKKWKQICSPCVVIVCVSARRAVAVLKDLASLKVRVAKLFPKNGSIESQREQVASIPFGIAVGTPHRLHALSQTDLSFKNTQSVVLDCQVSSKDYTVLTLPDTAPHCMSLLRECIQPELERRKDIRITLY